MDGRRDFQELKGHGIRHCGRIRALRQTGEGSKRGGTRDPPRAIKQLDECAF